MALTSIVFSTVFKSVINNSLQIMKTYILCRWTALHIHCCAFAR